MKQSDELGSDVAITCSRCHGPNHTKRRCLENPCPTSISCGKIRFHKTEMKIFETKKTQLKQMTRDKIALESECRKVRETIASTVKSFPQAIKTALINSNKKEYLTVHEGKFVPLTTRINRDISVLHKYYNGRVPDDLEQKSALFPAIIAEADQRLQLNSFSIENKLEDKLSSVHSEISMKKSTPNHDYINLDSSPEVETVAQSRLSTRTNYSVTALPNSPFTCNSPPSKFPNQLCLQTLVLTIF